MTQRRSPPPCEYIAQWLRAAPSAVGALNAVGGGATDVMAVVGTLDRLADVLTIAVASRTGHRVTTTTPLTPGEALGLADLLVDVAAGFTCRCEPAQWIADDCRRWAMRLAATPGIDLVSPNGPPPSPEQVTECGERR